MYNHAYVHICITCICVYTYTNNTYVYNCVSILVYRVCAYSNMYTSMHCCIYIYIYIHLMIDGNINVVLQVSQQCG